MQVIDATNESIKQYCSEITSTLHEKLVNQKNLVIAIEAGGTPIAHELQNSLCAHGLNSEIAAIRCQRPSSKKKKSSLTGKLFKKTLHKLPKPILNILRVIEHEILSRTRNPAREIVTSFNSFNNFYNIILVDDAIDSGYSLKKVYDYVRAKAPNSKIITVVYVVTQETPVIEPDFCNIRNVLVRFPWSSDS